MTARVALVTGGSGAIGAATARALAADGHRLAVTFRSNRDAATATCQEIEGLGGEAIAVPWTGTEAATAILFDEVQERLGEVEVLVNVAGIRRDAPLPMMSVTAWQEVLATDLTGVFLTMRHASRGLVRRRWGRIVNVGSVASTSGIPGQAAYAAAKAGLIGLTRTAARELAGRGTTVNLVAAGAIRTEMLASITTKAQETFLERTPVGRFGTVDEVAAAIRFLCSDDAGFITGAVLPVDGGAGMGW